LFFLELAEESEHELRSAEQAAWLKRLEVDHDNLRAALDWSLAAGDTREAGLRLSSALVFFWMTRGYTKEGLQWLERELAMGDEISKTPHAKALAGAGTMAFWQGDYARAISFHQDSLTLYRALDDQLGMADSLNNLGIQAIVLGNLEQALPLFQESLQISRTLGDKAGIAKALSSLGFEAHLQGNLELAATYYSESLALNQELGDLQWIATTLHNLGRVVIQQGHPEQAMLLHKESLRMKHQLGEKPMLPDLFEALAEEFGAQNRPERAARLLGAAAVLREALHTRMYPVDQPDYERIIAMVRVQLDEAAFAAALSEGRSMTLEQAIEYALETKDEA
jgi:tetratricopeptide (TPR) repeat protein